jgi:hypothetical protein
VATQPKYETEFRGRKIRMVGPHPAVRVARDDPAMAIAFTKRYVTIHRLIASEMLGRWVTSQDRVSHRDGNVWNWDPSNLVITTLPPSRYRLTGWGK